MQELEEGELSLQGLKKQIDSKLGAIFDPKVTLSSIQDAAEFIVESVVTLSPDGQLACIRSIDEYFQLVKAGAARGPVLIPELPEGKAPKDSLKSNILQETSKRGHTPSDHNLKVLKKLKTQIIHRCGNAGEYSNWKDALLGVHYHPISRTFLQQQSVYPDADNAIDLADKGRFIAVKRKNICAVSGSSFVTNREVILRHARDENGQLNPEPILDASYSASTQNGWVMAVGDGCGHGQESLENEDIGRTAYFAGKDACRLMARYPDADTLRANLNKLAKQVSDDIIVKVRAHRGQPLKPDTKKSEVLKTTTLVCARAFQRDDDNFRLVGFNVGDTMLIAYDPATGQFQTVAKARQIIGLLGLGHPAALPNLYSDEQMMTFDVTLPRGSIVFGLSDGVWAHLPVQQNSQADQERTGYIDTEIDFDVLSNDPEFKLPESVNVSTVTQAIARYAVCKTEAKRKESLKAVQDGIALAPTLKRDIEALQTQGKQKNDPEVSEKIIQAEKAGRVQQFQIGDDFTLLGMQLDEIDLNPDYTTAEKVVSGLTLGLYALIRDCLHLRDDEKITLGDGAKAALAVVGFFATGTLAGLGYLAYKAIHAASSGDEQNDYRIDLKR